MPAGNQLEVLLRVADRLCEELGRRDHEPTAPATGLAAGASGPSEVLAPEEESLVATIRESLAQVATAVAAAPDEHDSDAESSDAAVRAALDGAELVIRGELVSGNADHLVSLMPSFVFLVTLPIVNQDQALELARRTAELIEDAL